MQKKNTQLGKHLDPQKNINLPPHHSLPENTITNYLLLPHQHGFKLSEKDKKTAAIKKVNNIAETVHVGGLVYQ